MLIIIVTTTVRIVVARKESIEATNLERKLSGNKAAAKVWLCFWFVFIDFYDIKLITMPNLQGFYFYVNSNK